jgi:hypothetical protein
MSFKSLLKHRCEVIRLQETFIDGMPVHSWSVVATNVKLFLDLNFVRLGKDPTWTAEAGRPTTRTGVAFFLKGAPIKNGDRIRVTKGPTGTFTLEAAVDESWQPNQLHHLEVSVQEVPGQIATGSDNTVGR